MIVERDLAAVGDRPGDELGALVAAQRQGELFLARVDRADDSLVGHAANGRQRHCRLQLRIAVVLDRDMIAGHQIAERHRGTVDLRLVVEAQCQVLRHAQLELPSRFTLPDRERQAAVVRFDALDDALAALGPGGRNLQHACAGLVAQFFDFQVIAVLELAQNAGRAVQEQMVLRPNGVFQRFAVRLDDQRVLFRQHGAHDPEDRRRRLRHCWRRLRLGHPGDRGHDQATDGKRGQDAQHPAALLRRASAANCSSVGPPAAKVSASDGSIRRSASASSAVR